MQEAIRVHSSQRGRIPELDGLRGIAILLVLTFHYFTTVTGEASGTFSYLHNFVAMGWAGVDLFFVLSGFLIGGILLDARNSPHYFRTFYIRRLYRIIPLYYAWICGYILLVAVVGTTHLRAMGPQPEARPPMYVYFLFLQNLKAFHISGVAAAWLGATWSLAVEEQFYLIIPLLIWLLTKRTLVIVLSMVILLAPELRFAVHNYVQLGPELVNVLMPCRADTFAMGILAAILWRNAKARTYLATNKLVMFFLVGASLAGLLVVSAKWYSRPWSLGMQTIGLTLIALFFAVILLFVLSRPDGITASITRMRGLREIGTVSYCMYIIHIAVQGACQDIVLSPSIRQSADWTRVAVLIAAAILTYAIAKISWIFFEKPLFHKGHAYHY
jgi:peptidoglycan/LPS O-acetylase OafA/YrhL